ncbi:hypothetical protein CKO36_18585 [Rhabdochromatium marinum]|nr:hypothetical protein [Rhabdochromatium marinum]
MRSCSRLQVRSILANACECVELGSLQQGFTGLLRLRSIQGMGVGLDAGAARLVVVNRDDRTRFQSLADP